MRINAVNQALRGPRAVSNALRIAKPTHAKEGVMKVPHAGPIPMSVPGRTDRIPMHVHAGSYVIPADTVSGMGEGNTAAGNLMINRQFAKPIGSGSIIGRARGGRAPNHELVPIVAAGGEYVLTPEEVTAIGKSAPRKPGDVTSDLDRGHMILDEFVKKIRKSTIKTLRKLPKPARD